MSEQVIYNWWFTITSFITKLSEFIFVYLLFFLWMHKSPISWGCKIHQLGLCKGVRPPHHPSECPGYDIKLSEASVLEYWEIKSTPSLPLVPGSL